LFNEQRLLRGTRRKLRLHSLAPLNCPDGAAPTMPSSV
jgi:hypothetical protein